MILLPEESLLFAQGTPPVAPPPASATAPAPVGTAAPAADALLPAEQLDALVAPIALYPDTLLAQALVASTYPLEVVALQQWLVKNKDLKDKALTDAVAKQPWDPAIQGMAVIPDLVKRLADDIQWTTELGNAFLAQQSDVMDAVQRMRHKATGTGALVSNEQQKVETTVIEEKTVIVVQQANPEVIYVPTYNPTVVYGPPPYYYPYPPVYYPPPGAAFVSFSIGVAVGAAFWGGGCGWGHNEINIDVDRNVNRNTNINSGNRGSGNRGGNTWSHNSQHRGAAPYSSKSTANKFSGSTTRTQAGAGNRASATSQSLGAGNRSGGMSASASSANRSASAGSRSTSAGQSNIGSRSVPQNSGSRSSGFSGGSSGFNSSSARASSTRGASSMGGSRGGGGGRRR